MFFSRAHLLSHFVLPLACGFGHLDRDDHHHGGPDPGDGPAWEYQLADVFFSRWIKTVLGKLTDCPPHCILLHSKYHPDDRSRDQHTADAPQPIQARQQRPERRAGLVPGAPLRAEHVSLLAVHGDHVFTDNVYSRPQRITFRDGAEAERGPYTHRSQRDEDDELAADEQDEHAQRQRSDLDAGGVPADADGDDDAHHDEAEGEVPVKVVERPGATAAERAACGGFPRQAHRAQDERIEAHDAEDGGEDGEDVGRFKGGGVADGEVADEGEDAAGENDDGGV